MQEPNPNAKQHLLDGQVDALINQNEVKSAERTYNLGFVACLSCTAAIGGLLFG